MKKRLLALALALALLAGCGQTSGGAASTLGSEPAASTAGSAPAPRPAPEPIAFEAFLAQVNARHRQELEQAALLDITPYIQAASTFDSVTPAEAERLLTPPTQVVENLTGQQAAEDAGLLFRLLQSTYGAYGCFGGDEVFLPLRDKLVKELQGRESVTVQQLDQLLGQALAPLVRDGHMTIGSTRMTDTVRRDMWYVPGLYFTSPAGLDESLVKPTVGPDGAIVYGFIALSRDGSDLPGEAVVEGKTQPLAWQKAQNYSTKAAQIFTRAERDGIPWLQVRRFYARASRAADKTELEAFVASGEACKDRPLVLADVRANTGGSDDWSNAWFEGLTGQKVRRAMSGGQKLSLARHMGYVARGTEPWWDTRLDGSWTQSWDEGRWTENPDQIVFALMDKGTASSGETMVQNLQTLQNTLFVGSNTAGCALVPNNLDFWLPNSGLNCYFGTGIFFVGTAENRDGVGLLPDLWVPPTDAADAVFRLCKYYGLNQ